MKQIKAVEEERSKLEEVTLLVLLSEFIEQNVFTTDIHTHTYKHIKLSPSRRKVNGNYSNLCSIFFKVRQSERRLFDVVQIKLCCVWNYNFLRHHYLSHKINQQSDQSLTYCTKSANNKTKFTSHEHITVDYLCDSDLAEAMPILKAALSALDTITQSVSVFLKIF